MHNYMNKTNEADLFGLRYHLYSNLSKIYKSYTFILNKNIGNKSQIYQSKKFKRISCKSICIKPGKN